MGLLEPRLKTLRDYLQGRLRTELAELKPITIEARVKTPEGVSQKLQTGRYQSLADLDDLVGLKVVLVRRSMIVPAIEIVRGACDVIDEVQRKVNPTEFAYRQPHLIVRPQAEYGERHPELSDIRAEIQFTTALQHALDTATHDFDYKGASFGWQNFRIVAQLRGTLELADSILDNVEASAAFIESGVSAPQELIDGQATLDVLLEAFSPEVLPPDQRRMATIVRAWLAALQKDAEWLRRALGAHADLVHALSLSPVDAVLGVMLREAGDDLVSGYSGCLFVSAELESLCPQANIVPAGRRVVVAQ